MSVEGSPSESFTCHEAEEERSSGGAGEEHGCSPWAMYQRSLQKRCVPQLEIKERLPQACRFLLYGLLFGWLYRGCVANDHMYRRSACLMPCMCVLILLGRMRRT